RRIRMPDDSEDARDSPHLLYSLPMFPSPREAHIMKKLAIAAVAALALVAAALLPRLLTPTHPAVAADKPATAAPAPGVPVTAGTVTAADVPVLLNAIGSVQAYNMVT